MRQEFYIFSNHAHGDWLALVLKIRAYFEISNDVFEEKKRSIYSKSVLIWKSLSNVFVEDNRVAVQYYHKVYSYSRITVILFPRAFQPYIICRYGRIWNFFLRSKYNLRVHGVCKGTGYRYLVPVALLPGTTRILPNAVYSRARNNKKCPIKCLIKKNAELNA